MPHACGITHLLCGSTHTRPPDIPDDEAIAGLAARQQGVTGRRQLLELRVSGRSIDYRISVGRLRPLFPGIYAVGHDAVPPAGRALAAVMSCWPYAAGSHETAIALAGLIAWPAGAPHVTCTRHRAWQPGRITHRCRTLPPLDLTVVNGIPSTTVPRAIFDLAPRWREAALLRLIKDAEFDKKLRIGDLAQILERYPRRHGRVELIRVIRPLLADSRPTRSPLEDRFLAFCRRRGLPLPETNVRLRINGRIYEPDCLWRDVRIIVELDGRDAHMRELAFHEDRKRDRALISAGWIPMRVTSDQLGNDADPLEADIRGAFATWADACRMTHTGRG